MKKKILALLLALAAALSLVDAARQQSSPRPRRKALRKMRPSLLSRKRPKPPRLPPHLHRHQRGLPALHRYRQRNSGRNQHSKC